MKRALFFHNPRAGRGRLSGGRKEQLIGAIQALGLEVTVVAATFPPGNLNAAHFENQDVVIVYGGDGTIHEVLRPALQCRVPVAIVPAGTANVLAGELSIPSDPGKALDLLRCGRRLRIRLGKSGDTYFHLMVGVGPDAHIIGRTSPAWKRRLGVGSYWLAGFKALPNLPLEPFEIHLDEHRLEATFAVISNSRYYGGRLRVAPAADMTEDCLDVCLFTSRRRSRYLTYLLGVLTGKHVDFADVHYRKARRVRVVGGPSIPVQMDGELTGTLPLELSVAERSLEVFVPR